MEAFLAALGARLTGDSTLIGHLGGRVAEAVFQGRQPDSPKGLRHLVLVYTLRNWPDSLGRHGGAVDPEVEVDLWGYDGAHLLKALKAMPRIDELLLLPFTTAELGEASASLRMSTNPGWQTIDDQDPATVHYRARYTTRLWVAGRIATLNPGD